MLTPRSANPTEARASRQITADLVNAVVAAAEKDTVHQAAMLIAVLEVLAKHSSDAHRVAIAQVIVGAVRRLDPDVPDAPAHLH